jgi:radical SAM protein with 4Fe4S-binding SPASM domain
MRNKQLLNATPGGKRTPLREALPLDTPFLVQIFPCYACNFKCGYCIFSLEKEKRAFISDVPFMSWQLYTKCVDDMKKYPKKIKMLRFAAIGEPLLHPRIADMVSYAKHADIAKSVDIVTNSSLLTPELSRALISSGLDRLRISLNGLSSEEYKFNTGAVVDFNRLIDNIRYFYENKTNTHIYIKIIDYMLKNTNDENKFYSNFSDICDTIAIEHLTPTIAEIDYFSLSGRSNDRPQNSEVLLDTEVCPQGFYMMQVNPDGKVVPCCNMTYPDVLGDANNENIVDIWNGTRYNAFRCRMLASRDKAGFVCGQCLLYRYDLHKEDILDGVKASLLQKYEAKEKF